MTALWETDANDPTCIEIEGKKKRYRRGFPDLNKLHFHSKSFRNN